MCFLQTCANRVKSMSQEKGVTIERAISTNLLKLNYTHSPLKLSQVMRVCASVYVLLDFLVHVC